MAINWKEYYQKNKDKYKEWAKKYYATKKAKKEEVKQEEEVNNSKYEN